MLVTLLRLPKPSTATVFSSLGFLGALGASTCCLLPLGMVALGIGGAWMPALTGLAPYQGLFLFVSAGALCAGFGTVYAKPEPAEQHCDDEFCAPEKGPRLTRFALWLGLLIWLSAVLINFVPIAP